MCRTLSLLCLWYFICYKHNKLQATRGHKHKYIFLIKESTSAESVMDSWVVVTSSFFIDLLEYSQVTS